MSSILKILAVSSRETRTGTIVSKQDKGFYRVRVGNQIKRIKSALSVSLQIGSGVVIAYTENGMFIIGKEKLKSRTKKEITIDG